MIASEDIIILIRILLAHIIADFVLQSDGWIKKKFQYGYRSKELYIHILIVGLLTYLFIGKWNEFFLPALIMIFHLVIDLWKISKENNLKYFLIDQASHLITIIAGWYIFISSGIDVNELISTIFNDPSYLLIIGGYLVVLLPFDYLIGFSTERWRLEITDSNTEGLKQAGKWIGKLERILILTFILVNRFEAIGFLIAAKSILRYGEIKNSKDRKEAEYILIGTLLSFTLTIITGIIINRLLR